MGMSRISGFHLRRFKDHLREVDGTPSAEVEKLLPAALKVNGHKPGIFGGEEEDAREETTRLTVRL